MIGPVGDIARKSPDTPGRRYRGNNKLSFEDTERLTTNNLQRFPGKPLTLVSASAPKCCSSCGIFDRKRKALARGSYQGFLGYAQAGCLNE
jgi:hypothetical protein